MKLVWDYYGEIALYNLRKDPSETKNLLAEDRGNGRGARQLLECVEPE